jgi:hypothetical protein
VQRTPRHTGLLELGLNHDGRVEISIVQALPDIAEQAFAVSAAATEAAAAEAAAAEAAAGEGREPGASGNL